MFRSRFLAALPVVLASTSALAGTVGPAPVVGGGMVPPGKWPDAVAVLGPDGSCTGTLVAPDVVLTAGHCVGIHPNEVVVNTTNYNGTGGTRIAVESITPYPSYQHSFDVAAVVLASPVTSVAPRAMGKRCSFSGFAEDTMVHLVGFGLTTPAGDGNNTSLREAMAPVLDADCSGGNGCRSAVAPAGEFVAGGNGTDSCFGDSGGPVYLDTARGPIVIASVSRGLDGTTDGDTPCGSAAIYVRTDKILAWVAETTGRDVATDSCEDDATELSAEAPPGGGAGCNATGSASGALWLVGPLAAMLLRRRRAA